MSSLIWDEVWKHSLSPDIHWFAEEFLHYLVNWSLDMRYLLFLEPGAGSGRFGYYLAKRTRRVVALDLSCSSVNRILDLGRESGGLLEVIRADILNMPFKDGAFDVVYNEGVVEHFPQPYPVLCEMVRVTRKLGIVIFSVPNIFSFHTFGKLMRSGSISISKPYGFERSFHKSDVYGMLQLLGLRNIEVHGIGLFYGVARYMPFPVYRLLYRAYIRLRNTRLGLLLGEFAGFQIVGKGEKR